MGGARCSYRNCSAKSDGTKTHLFHYPVYAKQRCRQWLLNAQKLNFVDLNVSQLKNRVICQHHFTDDQFMNCMKNKLKNDAVPTQNGPYCTDPDIEDEDEQELLENGLTLIEDIENEVRLTANEKKASKVLKYADFLTANDPETEYLIPKNVPSRPQQENDPVLMAYFTNKSPLNKKRVQSYFTCKALPSDSTAIKSEKVVIKDMNNKALVEIEVPFLQSTDSAPTIAQKELKIRPNGHNKIKILSETKLTTAPEINPDELLMVSPSSLINPNKVVKSEPIKVEQQNIRPLKEKQPPRQTSFDNVNVIINNHIQLEKDMFTDQNVPNIANLPVVFLDETNCVSTTLTNVSASTDQPKTYDVDQSEKVTGYAKSSSPLKSKLPPERKAAIEEKRNFNKKLRDMIEFCLDELDDPEKVKNISKKDKSTPASTTMTSNKSPEKPAIIADSPAKRSLLKSTKRNQTEKSIEEEQQEMIQKVLSSQVAPNSALVALEARMARMEELLVQKIDKNTQQITELRNHVTNSDNFSRSLKEHEEAFKKRLYKEMSQYLSPAAKCLVYEELFINKYGKNEPDPDETAEVPSQTRSTKRRKR